MRRIKTDVATDLLDVLRETRHLLDHSSNSIWANSSVSELRIFIDKQITGLAGAQTCQTADLEVLFAPTGPLQDTAIDNGWDERFLQLSTEVDQLTRDN